VGVPVGVGIGVESFESPLVSVLPPRLVLVSEESAGLGSQLVEGGGVESVESPLEGLVSVLPPRLVLVSLESPDAPDEVQLEGGGVEVHGPVQLDTVSLNSHTGAQLQG